MGSTAHRPPRSDAFDDLIRQVESLCLGIEQQVDLDKAALLELAPERYRSAENLLHYLALRSQDLRSLQDRLARLGLSSLGRMEPHVLATLTAVLHNLYLVSGKKHPGPGSAQVYSTFDANADLLEQNTISLLGPHPQKRRAHIIVTISSEAADDYLMVHQLVKDGMDCMRINCSHDDPSTWSRMIEHLRNAERATGRSCRVLMDLGGPKLRTGPMESVSPVLKIRPVRASDGRVLRPARIWLSPVEAGQGEKSAADACLVLDPDWLALVMAGDRVRLEDTRGSRRNWRIREKTSDGCWAESRKTTYIANGTVLQLRGKKSGNHRMTVIEKIPPEDGVVLLRSGDILVLSNTDKPGESAIHDEGAELLSPGKVSLPIAQIYRDVRLGDPVCFDDGRITGIIEKLGRQQLQIRITHLHSRVEKLEANRGINLPDTQLKLPALGKKDLQDLEFAVHHADMVGLSFANSPDDVRALRERMRELGRDDVGVVLKIETKRGFANLPAILLEALKFPVSGIMIARGDLAVECGFERLAEVQEEMLWLCEAAHVPVIWATQVLEGLTKRGHATRAEITDAAMSQAAEAVMLNKGPYIIEAVKMLDDILQRMQGHHRKKHSMLRELQMASEFSAERT